MAAYPRQIIIVLRPDGSIDNAAILLAENVGGRIYDLDPVPVSADDTSLLAQYLGPVGAAAVAAKANLEATIATLTADKQAAEAARDAALARVAELEAQLAISHADDLPAAIRLERDRRIVAGVRVGDHWYHSDLQMQVQVLGMVIMGANLPAGSTIKTLDDGPQPATPQLAQALFGAMAQQMAALHAVADAAIAAQTPLDQIQWPPTYTPA